MAISQIKIAFGFFLLNSVMLNFSCAPSNVVDAKEDAVKIAKMQCVSRAFTHQKFLLSDQYSKLDQLLDQRKIKPGDAAKARAQLDGKKAVLVKQSQDKSDELLAFLKAVWKEKYKTPEQRRVLDSLTEIQLRQICTEAAP